MSNGKTVKRSGRQIGRTYESQDMRLFALSPGRRISRFGNKYTENRKNHSDLSRKKRL